ncbi:Zinc finger, RING-type [Corchorus capsularis]|uniref:RING-type E3 ubiquitin transferase n=1 Tax=Corchorus capsularis TaxID=210143 RepID=A0A1R3GN26_COCAP|nr:Zinc finger, RING-type [Corchorus capsularis]
MDPYYTICQESDDALEETYLLSPHNLFNMVLDFSYDSAKFSQSVIFRRDLILCEEHGPNLVLSMFPETAASSTLDFVRTAIVPDILSFAEGSNDDPRNRGRKVIKLTVEVDDRYHATDIDSQVIDVSLSYVNFKPASRSGIQSLKRVRYSDENDLLVLSASKKRRVMGSDSSECSICMEEFCNGEESALMPCDHVYHHSCIVRWLETSHYCPLCRYQMPS